MFNQATALIPDTNSPQPNFPDRNALASYSDVIVQAVRFWGFEGVESYLLVCDTVLDRKVFCTL